MKSRLYGLLDVDIIHARNCTQDTIVQSLVLKPLGLQGENNVLSRALTEANEEFKIKSAVM